MSSLEDPTGLVEINELDNSLRKESDKQESEMYGDTIQLGIMEQQNIKIEGDSQSMMNYDDEDDEDDDDGTTGDFDSDLLKKLESINNIDEFRKLSDNVSANFAHLSHELNRSKIQRAQGYISMISNLKSELTTQKQEFDAYLDKITPGRDITYQNEVSTDLTSAHRSKFVSLDVPLFERAQFPIFKPWFQKTLDPHIKKLKIFHDRYAYDFHNIESQKFNNSKIIWGQYFQDTLSAKSDATEEIKDELGRLEEELYNLTSYEQQSNTLAREKQMSHSFSPENDGNPIVPIRKSFLEDEQYYATQAESYRSYNQRISKIKQQKDDDSVLLSSTTAAAANSGAMLKPATTEDVYEDLFKLKLMAQDKKMTRSKHSRFLDDVLKRINEPKNQARVSSIAGLLSSDDIQRNEVSDFRTVKRSSSSIFENEPTGMKKLRRES
ncbi:hypothetical protein DASC09_020300 [Saccharomycopsis crataegensis]|uniref:Uncharacterized protein n=1 Tax=Saccharomycopsis crataegensis TaxID=43959 RepID=A0AAV5QID7_9ASCO|nr:hypothetical protein DASC09_020300 [Saccharomycopsis crataegensis]